MFLSMSNDTKISISWLGHSMFLIEFRQGLRVVTDPYDLKTGYRPPAIEADIVTISHHHHDHDNASAVGGSPEIIDKIGNHAIDGVSITGISSFHDEVFGAKRGENIIFRFDCEDLSLVHMGDIGQLITDKQAEALQGIDIMMIPIGGTYTIDHTQAVAIVRSLKPKIVLPMHFRTKHYAGAVQTSEPFIREMSDVRKIGTTVAVSKTILPEDTQVWVMEYMQ